MSEEKQIEDIKNRFISTVDPNTRNKVLDALASYGSKAIDPINELIKLTVVTDVKSHGLDLIRQIREKLDQFHIYFLYLIYQPTCNTL
jgi:hypothetical protein